MENLVAGDEKGKAGGREGIFSQKKASEPRGKLCPCSSHRAWCWSPSSGAAATLCPPHPRGFTGSDDAAECCRCLGKSNPSQNATPARWGLSASRVLVSLAPLSKMRKEDKSNPLVQATFLCTTGSFSKKRIMQWKTPSHRETPSEGRKSFYI